MPLIVITIIYFNSSRPTKDAGGRQREGCNSVTRDPLFKRWIMSWPEIVASRLTAAECRIDQPTVPVGDGSIPSILSRKPGGGSARTYWNPSRPTNRLLPSSSSVSYALSQLRKRKKERKKQHRMHPDDITPHHRGPRANFSVHVTKKKEMMDCASTNHQLFLFEWGLWSLGVGKVKFPPRVVHDKLVYLIAKV